MPRARPRPAPAVRADEHLDWAERIARRVARKGGLSGQERADLVATAHLTLLEICARPPARGGFDPVLVPEGGDPAGAFRGWAHPTVRCACVREAARIRGGGLFRTKRPEIKVSVAPAGDQAEHLPDHAEHDALRDLAPPDLDTPDEDAVPYGRRLALGSAPRPPRRSVA